MTQVREVSSPTHGLLEVDDEGLLLHRPRRAVATASVVVGGLAIMGCLVAFLSVVDQRPAFRGQQPDVVEFTLLTNKVDEKKSSKENEKKTKISSVNETAKTCSWGRENCNATKCCNNPGMLCYEQSGYYAQCRESCTPGPDPSHWDGADWTCKELGERSEGSPPTCSNPGEDCSESKCCTQAGTRCYEKGPGWAACKSECYPWAPDLSDNDGKYWTCKELGPMKSGASPWVEHQCSGDGEDCRSTKCCRTPGSVCYEQSADWAACQPGCTPGKDPERFWEPEWSCNELGQRTPSVAEGASGVVSSWVQEECAWDGTDCKGSRCCIGMNKACYKKNDDFAMCMEECTPGRHLDDNNETWACDQLGPRSNGLAVRGNPSLLCWSLFQTTSYEMGIIQNQMNRGIGIFACDGHILLSTDDPTVIGNGVDGKEEKTKHVDYAEITTSVDGTAGNAALFINCWNVIVEDGRWNNYAWTVKVDPDAVLLPDRLRQHLAPHYLENIFVLNCNAYPSSPEFPMMYGSLEIFSWKAVASYAGNMWRCMQDMSQFIPQWGEDRFMKKCLDLIGVGAVQDFAVVGDGVCTGVDCGAGYTAAFHPFKTVDSWQQCFDTATR